MSEEKGISRHPIVVAVVGGLTVPAALAIAHYEGVTVESTIAWLSRTATFWAMDVALPRWAFWLWLLFSVASLLLIALRIYFALTEESPPVAAAAAKHKSASPHQTYTTDVFFKFRWRWKTNAAGQVWDISMYCPKCDQELTRSDFEGYRYDAHLCRCSHCGYAEDVSGDSPLDMYDQVKRAAERKIRTGEWEKASKQLRSSSRA